VPVAAQSVSARIVLHAIAVSVSTLMAWGAQAQALDAPERAEPIRAEPLLLASAQVLPVRKTSTVVTSGVSLITSQEEMRQRVRVEDFLGFIQAVEAKARPILAASKTGALVLLQFSCAPERHDVKIASKGDPPEPILLALYDAMQALPPLRTDGAVAFQVEMGILP
jgi:hypothetical protein